MTTNRTHSKIGLLATFVLGIGAAGILAGSAQAQQSEAPAGNGLLSIAEIERRVSAEGLQVTDIELRDGVAEVEGRDSSGREVEWIVDRRDGRILSRDLDD
jgi:hypothetical protein